MRELLALEEAAAAGSALGGRSPPARAPPPRAGTPPSGGRRSPAAGLAALRLAPPPEIPVVAAGADGDVPTMRGGGDGGRGPGGPAAGPGAGGAPYRRADGEGGGASGDPEPGAGTPASPPPPPPGESGPGTAGADAGGDGRDDDGDDVPSGRPDGGGGEGEGEGRASSALVSARSADPPSPPTACGGSASTLGTSRNDQGDDGLRGVPSHGGSSEGEATTQGSELLALSSPFRRGMSLAMANAGAGDRGLGGAPGDASASPPSGEGGSRRRLRFASFAGGAISGRGAEPGHVGDASGSYDAPKTPAEIHDNSPGCALGADPPAPKRPPLGEAGPRAGAGKRGRASDAIEVTPARGAESSEETQRSEEPPQRRSPARGAADQPSTDAAGGDGTPIGARPRSDGAPKEPDGAGGVSSDGVPGADPLAPRIPPRAAAEKRGEAEEDASVVTPMHRADDTDETPRSAGPPAAPATVRCGDGRGTTGVERRGGSEPRDVPSCSSDGGTAGSLSEKMRDRGAGVPSAADGRGPDRDVGSDAIEAGRGAPGSGSLGHPEQGQSSETARGAGLIAPSAPLHDGSRPTVDMDEGNEVDGVSDFDGECSKSKHKKAKAVSYDTFNHGGGESPEMTQGEAPSRPLHIDCNTMTESKKVDEAGGASEEGDGTPCRNLETAFASSHGIGPGTGRRRAQDAPADRAPIEVLNYHSKERENRPRKNRFFGYGPAVDGGAADRDSEEFLKRTGAAVSDQSVAKAPLDVTRRTSCNCNKNESNDLGDEVVEKMESFDLRCNDKAGGFPEGRGDMGDAVGASKHHGDSEAEKQEEESRRRSTEPLVIPLPALAHVRNCRGSTDAPATINRWQPRPTLPPPRSWSPSQESLSSERPTPPRSAEQSQRDSGHPPSPPCGDRRSPRPEANCAVEDNPSPAPSGFGAPSLESSMERHFRYLENGTPASQKAALLTVPNNANGLGANTPQSRYEPETVEGSLHPVRRDNHSGPIWNGQTSGEDFREHSMSEEVEGTCFPPGPRECGHEGIRQPQIRRDRRPITLEEDEMGTGYGALPCTDETDSVSDEDGSASDSSSSSSVVYGTAPMPLPPEVSPEIVRWTRKTTKFAGSLGSAIIFDPTKPCGRQRDGIESIRDSKCDREDLGEPQKPKSPVSHQSCESAKVGSVESSIPRGSLGASSVSSLPSGTNKADSCTRNIGEKATWRGESLPAGSLGQNKHQKKSLRKGGDTANFEQGGPNLKQDITSRALWDVSGEESIHRKKNTAAATPRSNMIASAGCDMTDKTTFRTETTIGTATPHPPFVKVASQRQESKADETGVQSCSTKKSRYKIHTPNSVALVTHAPPVKAKGIRTTTSSEDSSRHLVYDKLDNSEHEALCRLGGSNLHVVVLKTLSRLESGDLPVLVTHAFSRNLRDVMPTARRGTIVEEVKLCMRTFEYLKAIALGARVLDAQWLKDSEDAGKWLPYDRYEIWGDLGLYGLITDLAPQQDDCHSWVASAIWGRHGICRSSRLHWKNLCAGQASPKLAKYVVLVLPDSPAFPDGSRTIAPVEMRNSASTSFQGGATGSKNREESNRPSILGNDCVDNEKNKGLDDMVKKWRGEGDQLNSRQVKILIQLLGGTVVTDERTGCWKSCHGNMQRLIIVPDKLSVQDLTYIMAQYCLKDGNVLPKTTCLSRYDDNLDHSEDRTDTSILPDIRPNRVPIVRVEWLADSISANFIAPVNDYCHGVACWQ